MKITNWKKVVVTTLLLAGAYLPPSTKAADLQVNLVANPSFEAVNTDDPGPFTSVRIGDWIDADADDDDNFAYPYSSGYSGNPAPPGSGDYHFTGGFSTTTNTATLTQSFDVAAGDSGGLIATGAARYDLRSFFSTYREQSDASFVQARFLDSGMNELGSASIGGGDFLAGLPTIAGQTYWGQDATSGVVPVGTETVAIDVISAGAAGNYDGYTDLVDFRIGGMPTDETMVLRVNTATGAAALQNATGSPIDFNYYEISSPSGSLSTSSWSSFQDQNLVGFPAGTGLGDGWEESGGSSALILGESYLLGSSVLEDGVAVGIGSPQNGDQDLTFRYGLENGLLLHGVVEYVVDRLRCDFDGSGTCDLADIDILVAGIVAGSTDAQFDLNNDGQVTLADITDEVNGWLRLAGEENIGAGRTYLRGDLNLDTVVDVADFNIWNANKFTATGTWSGGDLNADGFSDVGDFNIWNGAKFTSSDAIATVPEPGAVTLLILGLTGTYWLRRRR